MFRMRNHGIIYMYVRTYIHTYIHTYIRAISFCSILLILHQPELETQVNVPARQNCLFVKL